MTARTLETGLANFTLGVLAIYFPLETFASWGELTHPFYLVDLIGMLLLLWGALRSRRARPAGAPGILAAGWAWVASNGWRAAFGRVEWLQAGNALDFGLAELCAVFCGLLLALVCLGVSLRLVAKTT